MPGWPSIKFRRGTTMTENETIAAMTRAVRPSLLRILAREADLAEMEGYSISAGIIRQALDEIKFIDRIEQKAARASGS
jgi:hypothetical protein